MTEEFICNHMRYLSKTLPIAGLLNIFDDGEIFQCKPTAVYDEYLIIPKNHQDYANRYPKSSQCFAEQFKIKDFVLPLVAVEEYEKEHPEI